MANPISVFLENQREIRSRDERYYKEYTYYFELQVPARLAGGVGTFFFPLAIAPEAYRMETPFSVSEVQTQGGGLYVEEDGIVRRVITLEGTTGFYPREVPGVNRTALTALTPKDRSFTRQLQGTIVERISGQRHFHYLQDAVFNTYGDLKRDPATAEETRLYFHNPKDEESWQVVPLSFNMRRDQRILYRYDIQLLVVGSYETKFKDFSEDKSILDEINNVGVQIQNGIDLTRGAHTDLVAITDNLDSYIKDSTKILGNVEDILNAANDFVSGVTKVIEVPFALLQETTALTDASLLLAWQISESGLDAPVLSYRINRLWRTLSDGLDQIGTHPEAFFFPTSHKIEGLKKRQELRKSVTADRIGEALSGESPTTFNEVANWGSKLTPGDAQAADSSVSTGRAITPYTGSIVRKVAKGDTLVNLAARFLGDARLWSHIAAANNLRPPYVIEAASVELGADDSPFPASLGVGSDILIPSFDTPPSDLPLLPTLGVTVEEDAATHLLGTDVAIAPVAGRPGAPRFDIVEDAATGGTGPKTVQGIANLSQGMALRLSIEQGTDVLYKRLGMGPIIGTKFILTDLEAARSKIIEAINQDSRIGSVREVDFSDSTADALVSEITAEVRGFTTQSNVKVTLK